MLSLDWEELWSSKFGEAVHFWLLVFRMRGRIKNVYRLCKLHKIMHFSLGASVILNSLVQTAVYYPLDVLRAVRSGFVASFLLRISFTHFANQVKCYS